MENKKVIETEVWEPHPEKKGMVRFVNCRKVREVFNDLLDVMEENGMMPDEYFMLSTSFDENAVMPRDVRIIAYANWGGNEGVYLEVEMISEQGRERFATGKTLGETEEDYDRMQAIAGFIYKSFAGFGRVPQAPKEESEPRVLKLRHTAADICNLFEELLEAHDITIPDEYREGNDGEARLYGDTYYELESGVADILESLCKEVKGDPNVTFETEDY